MNLKLKTAISSSNVLKDISLSALEDDTVRKYRIYHEDIRMSNSFTTQDKEQYLQRIGAAKISAIDGKVHPTEAGLLMFGKETQIRSIFPNYSLEYEHREYWHLVNKDILLDCIKTGSGDWSGNLFDFYLLIVNKLTIDLKVPFKLNGMQRIENTPLHDIVRGTFVNCLACANYKHSGVMVANRFESVVYKSDNLQTEDSNCRAKAIWKLFKLLKFGYSDPSLKQPMVEEREEQGKHIVTVWKQGEKFLY